MLVPIRRSTTTMGSWWSTSCRHYSRLTVSSLKATHICIHNFTINPLSATLNRRATDHHIVIQWLVHWPLIGGLVQWGGAWAGPQPAQAPPHCTKCNSPPINGQCTNFVLFDVTLELPLESKWLRPSQLLHHCESKTYHSSRRYNFSTCWSIFLKMFHCWILQ